MKIVSVNFITSAVSPEQYPEEGLPEIAFVGRSNVGKSSLINSLVNRKRLVKTSSSPGKTRLINFFCVNDAFMFVDLPGYGYANVPKSVRSGWKNMIESYFKFRKQLRGVVHLVDSRHNPTKDDIAMFYWLNHYNINAIVTGTKVDKIPKSKRAVHEKNIKKAFSPNSSVPFIFFSAKNGEGKEDVWEAIISNLK